MQAFFVLQITLVLELSLDRADRLAGLQHALTGPEQRGVEDVGDVLISNADRPATCEGINALEVLTNLADLAHLPFAGQSAISKLPSR